MLSSSLESGTALAEALSEPTIQARVANLQARYSIDGREHEEVCEALLGSEGVLIRRARELTQSLIHLGALRAALMRVQGGRESLARLLLLSLDRRQALLAARVAAQLSALGDSEESLSIVRTLAQSRSAVSAVLRLASHLHPDLVSVLENPDPTPASAEGDIPLDRALAKIATSWEPAARRIAQALSPSAAGHLPGVAPLDDLPLLKRMGQLGVSELFGHLSLESLEKLSGGATSREYAPGQLIYAQGAPSNEVLLVVEGAAYMLVETPTGTARVGEVIAGQTIGELGAITGEPRGVTAVAEAGGASVLCIPTAAFRSLLDQDVRTATGVLRLVSERLAESLGNVSVVAGAPWLPLGSEPN
jgi:CRP-like cAMP-binding protein